MEIIKPRTDTRKQVTCGTCGAVIAYYQTEVKYYVCKPRVTRWGRTIPGLGFHHIVCPSCGCIINLEKNEQV